MKKLRRKLKKLVKNAKLKKSAYFAGFLQKFNVLLENIKKSFDFGALNWQQARILVLAGLIIFSGYFILVKQYYCENFLAQTNQWEQKNPKDIERENLKKDLQALVKGNPIEAMVPYISTKDRKTAAYVVAIAKKESNWGKRKPVLDGQDCYNYWGFRAKRERMGSGGHTCFDNPKQAVDAVAKRIDQIIKRNDAESAKNMIVWKCGSNCESAGGQDAADKWIDDVDLYANKVLN